MDSRRTVLKKLLAGTAGVAAAPGTAAASTNVLGGTLASATGVSLPSLQDGPAPWWLIAPVGLGAPLRFGWYVAGLSPVRQGAAVLTLKHATGRSADVHLCARAGRGLASTTHLDLVLMDGGTGSFRTDERLGRVILGLAERIRRNEASGEGDLRPIARMMTHDERLATFGPENLG